MVLRAPRGDRTRAVRQVNNSSTSSYCTARHQGLAMHVQSDTADNQWRTTGHAMRIIFLEPNVTKCQQSNKHGRARGDVQNELTVCFGEIITVLKGC